MSTQEWHFRQLVEVKLNLFGTRYLVLLDGLALHTARGKPRAFQSREKALKAGRREARTRWLARPEEVRQTQLVLLEFQPESFVAHTQHGKYVIHVAYKDRPIGDDPARTYAATEYLPYFHPRTPADGEPRCVFVQGGRRCTTYQQALDCCVRHAAGELAAAAPTAPGADA